MNTILVVDDHAAFRRGLRALLESEGFVGVGEAETGQMAVDAAMALEPDLVIVDIGLPDVDGFAVVRELAARGSRAAIVLTSSRDAASFGARLASAAAAFVPKDELGADAIQQALGR